MRQRSRYDELATTIFMLLAIGAAVCFFVLDKGNPTYMVLGGLAVLVRLVQYAIRFFR